MIELLERYGAIAHPVSVGITGNIEKAKELITDEAAGGRLDIRDDLLKSTPLGWACRWGLTDLVKLFLDRGTDPVEPDAEPWATPRAWAGKGNHSAVLALIGNARLGECRLGNPTRF